MIANALARAFSRRMHPSTPHEEILYALTGGRSAASKSGITITETNSLQASAVYACVRVLSESVAQLPLHIFHRMSDGSRERAVTHPLYRILNLQPNPKMSSMVWRETLMGHILIWGNCYSAIDRDGGNRVIALWPLRPDRMTVKNHPTDSNRIQYLYASDAGREMVFDMDNILHVPGLSFDGIRGYSVISKMREMIGLSLGAEEYAARYFGEGARPPLALIHPGTLKPEGKKNLKEAWQKAYGGLQGAHKTALLEEGIQVEKIGFPPQDSQMLETRKFQISEIARAFRVPLHMLQELDRSTFSNIEQQSLDFAKYSIGSWIRRFDEYFHIRLLNADPNYYTEHLTDNLLKPDIKSRYEAYAVGRQNGWLNANEIREKENMNAMDGGDIYLAPMNLTDIKMLGQIQKVVSPPIGEASRRLEIRTAVNSRNRIIQRYMPLFAETAGRIVDREVGAVKRAAKKHLRNMNSFVKWLDEYYGDLPTEIRKTFLGLLMTYAETVREQVGSEIALTIDSMPAVDKFVNDYLDRYSQRHISSSLGQLKAIIQETDFDQQYDAIDQRVNEWQDTRPGKIAHRETNQLMNGIAAAALISMGYKRVWRTQGPSSCPYCQALEGKTVMGADEVFVQQGDFKPEGAETPMAIYGMRKQPPLHQGCDCFLMGV